MKIHYKTLTAKQHDASFLFLFALSNNKVTGHKNMISVLMYRKPNMTKQASDYNMLEWCDYCSTVSTVTTTSTTTSPCGFRETIQFISLLVMKHCNKVRFILDGGKCSQPISERPLYCTCFPAAWWPLSGKLEPVMATIHDISCLHLLSASLKRLTINQSINHFFFKPKAQNTKLLIPMSVLFTETTIPSTL